VLALVLVLVQGLVLAQVLAPGQELALHHGDGRQNAGTTYFAETDWLLGESCVVCVKQ
jgi:hypothetical protein